MTERMILGWAEEDEQNFENAVLCASHELHKTDLFSDDRLITTIDSHPREHMRVNTTDTDSPNSEWRDGDLGDLPGERILDAVRTGRLWLNLFNLSDSHGAFRDLTNKIYDELEERCPGFRALKRNENVLISSPSATVSYHVDPGATVLWHIRGRKRIWLYPRHDPRNLSQEDLERVCMQEFEGWEIPYSEAFDDHAMVYDLKPGDMISWPQHSPHRVVNQGELNVSFTTNHTTLESFRRNSVYRANGFFRRKFNRSPRSTRIDGVVPTLKIAAIFAIRMSRLYSIRPYEPRTSFQVDPSAPNGYIDRESRPA